MSTNRFVMVCEPKAVHISTMPWLILMGLDSSEFQDIIYILQKVIENLLKLNSKFQLIENTYSFLTLLTKYNLPIIMTNNVNMFFDDIEINTLSCYGFIDIDMGKCNGYTIMITFLIRLTALSNL